MSVELRLNGKSLPASLSSGLQYEIRTFVAGADVLPSRWSVTTGGNTVAEGRDTAIRFTPSVSASHTISATVVGEFGLYQDVAASTNVVPYTGLAVAGVRWSKLVYTPGEPIAATIHALDSTGLLPLSIAWVLSRNNRQVESGVGSAVYFDATQSGVFRLRGTADCVDGSELSFDSTVFVGGSVAVRHSVPKPDTGGTNVLLGSVYTHDISGFEGTATSLPYQLASYTQDIFLLPGTTHWSFELESTDNAPDEVVVRSKAGNWCLNGPPDGLGGEVIGYDYQYGPPIIYAAADNRVRITVDGWALHTGYAAFNFRVRIKCYRNHANVYKYTRCAYGNHTGGKGRRARRLAALFTNIDVETDVFSGLNRLGTGSAAVSYSTPETTNIPQMMLTPDGAPNPVSSASGLSFTDSNVYAIYESAGYPDIYAKAISAIENVRPASFSLLTFANGYPLVSSRIKRVYGKLAIYLTEGALYADTQLTVRVLRSGTNRVSTYSVTVDDTVYANEDQTFQKVTSIDVDIRDYQFDETGVVVEILVNETIATQGVAPGTIPDQQAGVDEIYAGTYVPALSYDGACYSNPEYAPIFDNEVSVITTSINGCHDYACGPVGMYCYVPLYGTGAKVLLPQPLGFPAPYVSYGSNPAACYYNPAFVAESATPSTVPLVTYASANFCGVGYKYIRCDSSYLTLHTNDAEIVVAYAPSSSPHPSVQVGNHCYYYAGTITSYGTRPVVNSGSITARTGCSDYYCSGSSATGSVVVYSDYETHVQVPVRFDHFEVGIPRYAVAAETIDLGDSLPTGQASVRFTSTPTAYLFTAPVDGQMMVRVDPPSPYKKLVISSSGVEHTVDLQGASRRIISVSAGDLVYLSATDQYGRVTPHATKRTTTVNWYPILALPRLYHTATMTFSGSAVIRALGFCGYTDHSPYTFYGTLPAQATVTGPVNPDSTVTVVSSGVEYALVTAKTDADINFTPLSVAPYAGQALASPCVFNFYAARSPAGAHGEMDVWLNSDGTIPPYLEAGPYSVLEYNGTSYRKISEPTDTLRNSYHVAYQPVPFLPRTFIADDGHVISSRSQGRAVTYNGTVFNIAGTDTGLAYDIVDTTVTFNDKITGSTDGVSTCSAVIYGVGTMSGTSEGVATCTGTIYSAIIYDSMESYGTSALNGLNGGTGFAGGYVDATGYLGIQALDTMETYADGFVIDGLNDGNGWAGVYVQGTGFTGIIASDDIESYGTSALNGLNAGSGWAGAFVS